MSGSPNHLSWRDKTASTRSLRRDCGFTLVEMLIVLAVLGVLAVLAALAVGNTGQSARAIKSLSQLRTIGWALDQYRMDHRNDYPAISSVDWSGETVAWTRTPLGDYLPLRPGRLANLVFICPNANYKDYIGYPDTTKLTRTFAAAAGMIGLNSKKTGADQTMIPRSFFSLKHPSSTIIVFDAKQTGVSGWCAANVFLSQLTADLAASGPETTKQLDFRHNGAAHFLFADGHIETLTHSAAKARITPSVWNGIE